VELGTTGWTGGGLLHYVGQSILHATIAAAIIEARCAPGASSTRVPGWPSA
jgi:hypothetical protein